MECIFDPDLITIIHFSERTLMSHLQFGDIVSLHSLNAAHFNGITGKLVKCLGDRWLVKLSDGRKVKIKPQNLKKEGLMKALILQGNTNRMLTTNI